MGRAAENMPDLTDDDVQKWMDVMDAWNDAMWDAVEAAQDDERDGDRNPHADPKCPHCHGTGTVYDMVDYGSTTVPMPSMCDCVENSEDVDA